jgi:hypothetical protein
MAEGEHDVLTIEDDDGYTTRWPWPKDRTLLGNGDFVSMCEMQHDALRAETT